MVKIFALDLSKESKVGKKDNLISFLCSMSQWVTILP
jgi:hypothetical protein